MVSKMTKPPKYLKVPKVPKSAAPILQDEQLNRLQVIDALTIAFPSMSFPKELPDLLRIPVKAKRVQMAYITFCDIESEPPNQNNENNLYYARLRGVIPSWIKDWCISVHSTGRDSTQLTLVDKTRNLFMSVEITWFGMGFDNGWAKAANEIKKALKIS
ncbi:MAG: hypothetical protein ABII22_05415 [Candidatus Micrarchaeota archaeon]